MALNIGNKVYRNLQEQVAWLTKVIEDIINGSDPSTAVVKLTDSEGELDDSQIEILSNDVSFIIYDNNLYIKNNDSEFVMIPKVESVEDEDYFEITTAKIEVDFENKLYISSLEVKQVYEINEVNSLISTAIAGIPASLIGKFVRIMDAPTSTTLTGAQKLQIINGAFTEGSITISGIEYKNLVFFPATEISGQYYGMFISSVPSASIGVYFINTANLLGLNASSSANISLRSIKEFNGKLIPSYPASTGTFGFKCVDGNLTWVGEPKSSVDFASIVPQTMHSDLTYTAKYCRFEEINGVLQIIWNFSLTNSTASDIASAGWTRISVQVPSALAQTIYDFKNKKVSESITSGTPITAFNLFTGSADYPDKFSAETFVCELTNNPTANELSLNVYINVGVKAGNECYCSGRIALTTI